MSEKKAAGDGETRVLGSMRSETAEQRKIKTYDFKRPDKFSREQIRTLHIVHERFALQMAEIMSNMMRCQITLSLETTDQMTFGEIMDEIKSPGIMAVLSLTPLRGPAMLQMDPDVAFGMLERLAGGSESVKEYRKEATELEKSIVARGVDSLLPALQRAWTNVIDLSCAISSVESRKTNLRVVPEVEMIVLEEFSFSSPYGEGRIRLIYPYLTIEPIVSRLSARYFFSFRQNGGNPLAEQVARNLSVNGEIRLDAAPLSLSQLRALKPGDTLRVSPDDLQRPGVFANGSRVLETRWDNPSLDGPVPLVPLIPAESGGGTEERLSAVKREIATMVDEKLEGFGAGLRQELQSLRTGLADTGRESAAEIEALPAYHEGMWTNSDFQDFTVDQGEHLYIALTGEYPQIQALVLSRLSNPLAADYIARSESGLRKEILKRISGMSESRDWVKSLLNEYLQKRMKKYHAEGLPQNGGIEKTVEILNYVPRLVEKEVIESWDDTDPDFSEEVKKRMFVFEDLSILPPAAIEVLLDQIPGEDWALAFKSTDEKLVEYFVSCGGRERMDPLLQASAELGRVRLSEVDAVQQRIIGAVRDLEEAGEIVVGRPGETIE